MPRGILGGKRKLHNSIVSQIAEKVNSFGIKMRIFGDFRGVFSEFKEFLEFQRFSGSFFGFLGMKSENYRGGIRGMEKKLVIFGRFAIIEIAKTTLGVKIKEKDK